MILVNVYNRVVLYFFIFSTILATLLYIARSINYPRHEQYQPTNLLFPTGGSIRKSTAQMPTCIRLKVGLRTLDCELAA